MTMNKFCDLGHTDVLTLMHRVNPCILDLQEKKLFVYTSTTNK